MKSITYWLSKLKESAISTMPIVVVIIIFFLVMRFGLPGDTFDASYQLTNNDIFAFLIAAVMIVVFLVPFAWFLSFTNNFDANDRLALNAPKPGAPVSLEAVVCVSGETEVSA